MNDSAGKCGKKAAQYADAMRHNPGRPGSAINRTKNKQTGRKPRKHCEERYGFRSDLWITFVRRRLNACQNGQNVCTIK
ncbi:MAG: hypothetical protein ACTTJV_02015 [Ottowia sp.]